MSVDGAAVVCTTKCTGVTAPAHVRHVDRQRGGVGEIPVAHVTGNADHLGDVLALALPQHDPTSHCTLARPQPLGHALTDDHAPRLADDILLREITPRDEPDAERLEVVARDHAPARPRDRVARGRWLVLRREAHPGSCTAQEIHAHRGDRLHLRQRFEARLELRERAVEAREVRVVARPGEGCLERQPVFGLESTVDREHGAEAANEKPSADEQDQ